jgi:Tol biopolymer transport system component
VMDADGGNPTRVAAGSETYDHPTWSPDGAMIAFDSFRLGPLRDIWIVNADGSGKTRLTRSSTTWFTCKERSIWFQEPRWSPDGTKLLFQGWREEGDTVFGSRLWVIELKQESSD